jgi:hypothetical protein
VGTEARETPGFLRAAGAVEAGVGPASSRTERASPAAGGEDPGAAPRPAPTPPRPSWGGGWGME